MLKITEKENIVVSAVIVSAGNSTRMGGINKQFLELDNMPVIAHSISAFQKCEYVDEIVIVTRESNIEEIINFAKENENVVIHLIAGLIKTILLNNFYDKHLKVLILGYKEIGRGINYFNKSIKDNICYIKDNILEISSHFYVISFDNLAIDQLDIKNKMDKEEFEKYYMGDDGNFTMYIDLVKKEFAISSTSLKRHPLLENIKDMFEIVKMESKVYDR